MVAKHSAFAPYFSWLTLLLVLFGAFSGCSDPAEEVVDSAEDELVACLPIDEFLYFPESSSWKTLNVVNGTDITVALQAALDAASGTHTPAQPVIVIPVGTYNISTTIRIQQAWAPMIVGAPPAGGNAVATTLKWTGPPNVDMFFIDWSQSVKMTRIILDGNNTARVGIHIFDSNETALLPARANSYFHELSDLTLKNMAYGLVAGVRAYDDVISTYVPLDIPGYSDTGSNVGDAVIRRCTFSNISKQGVVLDHYNAIDWSIQQSTFENSHIGIYIGAGQGNVVGCRFINNRSRDMILQSSMYGVVRENVSVGSAQFAYSWPVAGGYLSLIRNRVDTSNPPPGSPVRPAIELNHGSTMLLSNAVKTAPGVTSVKFRSYTGADIVDGFNQTSSAIDVPVPPMGAAPTRRLTVFPNTVATPTVVLPPVAPIAPNLNRPRLRSTRPPTTPTVASTPISTSPWTQKSASTSSVTTGSRPASRRRPLHRRRSACACAGYPGAGVTARRPAA